MSLKYLFTAIYEDGSTFQQITDDVSSQDPKRSAFYDVDHSRLIAFGIENDDNAIIVDLRDGSFEINGARFFAYDKEVINRRLVYFRRHTHSFNLGFEELAHETAYCIGWQGNDPVTKENIQRILIFS